MALDGRSVALDPAVNAVRPDLADVRLADRVFAPHYAAPVPRQAMRTIDVREARPLDAPVIATLAAGDGFEVLDIVGGDAWGIATGVGLVGYVDAAALSER